MSKEKRSKREKKVFKVFFMKKERKFNLVFKKLIRISKEFSRFFKNHLF